MRAFISYARQDIKYKNKFRKHLKAIEEKYALSVFDDRAILPGEEWEKRIWDEFNKSDIVFEPLGSGLEKPSSSAASVTELERNFRKKEKAQQKRRGCEALAAQKRV